MCDVWSDWFECWPQIAQVVDHLTRISGGLGSNPGLVCYYGSHPVTSGAKSVQTPGTERLTVLPGEESGVIFYGEDHSNVEECA